jgi:hypothetical protein
MERRTFNKLAGMAVMGGMGGLPILGAHPGLPSGPDASPAVKWPSQTYRRLLIDTHVPDWDPRLLADFDATEYVSTIAGAGFQSFMQYANSHVGLCLWRTKIGQMHAGMKGRDYFGEVMTQCRRHGLHRLAYYSLIFDDWAYKNHPEWRILPENGYDRILYSRTGTVCPNSPYREHAFACLRELVANYDFEGIFLDMVFWPAVCYCPYCTVRFWREHGNEPPRIVNFDDPLWKRFQAAREAWMLEFAKAATQTIKQTRPIWVYQQFGTAFAGWQAGVSLDQREASDFCGGDFYGGAAQFSLVCKTYTSLSLARPFEFMTSRTGPNLHDFETTKPLEQILVESMVPTIHSAAYLLIDAIKPNGTLDPFAYQYLGDVNSRHARYEPFLGGDLLADVAIYYDKGSMYDPGINGLHASDADPAFAYAGPEKPQVKTTPRRAPPHLDAVVGTARILREAHIPFGVVTNVTLDQLGRFRAVIIPSVPDITAPQAAQFRKFVQDGGVIYVSGPSSQGKLTERGCPLQDVLRVQYLGILGTQTTYLTPTSPNLKKLIWPQQNVTFPGPMVRARPLPGSDVLATVTLPFVAPEVGYTINTRFAQIWSNPPAMVPGQDPGIVTNSFGKGRAVWVAAPIESRPESVCAALVSHLLRDALPGPYYFELDADPAVEMTLLHQRQQHRLLVGLLNMPERLTTVPVSATVSVHLPSQRKPTRVFHVPDEKRIPFEQVGPYVRFAVAPFKIATMALVDYE